MPGTETPRSLRRLAARGRSSFFQAGEQVPVDLMSNGTRDQLFLAFRIAGVEQYCERAEPLPFIADDILVHFDDDRSAAALELLAELGLKTQVLLFTHHSSVRSIAQDLARKGRASIYELPELICPPEEADVLALGNPA